MKLLVYPDSSVSRAKCLHVV